MSGNSIDTSMNNKPIFSPTHNSEPHRWAVQLLTERSNEKLERTIKLLGSVSFVHEFIRLYLDAIIPDAVVVEPRCETIKTILIRTRTDQRRFLRQWGGRAT